MAEGVKITPGYIPGGVVSIAGMARYVLSRAPWQMIGALGFLVLASITEGVSVLLLVPILTLIDPRRPRIDIQLPTGLIGGVAGANLQIGLGTVLVALAVVVTLRAWLIRYKDLYTTTLLYDFINGLRDELFASVAAARWAFLANLRGSDINHALTADIDRVHLAVAQFLQLMQTFVLLVVYGVVALTISPLMSLFAGVVGVAIIILLAPIRRMALRYGASLTDQRQEQYRIVSEFLAGLKVAKSANAEPHYVSRLSATLGAMREGTLRFTRIYTIGGVFFQATSSVGLAGFVYVAVTRFRMPYSAIIALVFLFVRIAPRFTALHGAVQDILTNIPALTTMLNLKYACELEREPASIPLSPHQSATRDLDHCGVDVELRGIEFAYDRVSARPVLHDVSFKIPANEVTAIVGPSGGGKSTIADIIMGLLEPQSGALVVEGMPLAPGLRRAWRSRLAYVPQESFLLHDTIAANLAFGDATATEAAMWEALTTSNADKFVRELPAGLETVVGDRGLRLSGGERQRISLARALLRHPQLLLLDEATSALDWENQALVASAIERLRGRMTVVTIAHRPSMIAFADWIVAIDNGRVIETGRYADLARTSGSHLARILAGDR